ncbi:hypothetical protein ACM9HF_07860 [Colwellia sp. RE-S-Sl-9]
MLNLIKSLAVISLFVSWASTASLIIVDFDEVTYNKDDIVTMDVFVNSINSETYWLEFDLSFNDADLAFDGFIFDNNVFNNSTYTDAFDDFGFSPLTLQVEFLDDWQNELSTSFKLGTASFTALMDTNSPINTSLDYLDVQNFLGESIAAQEVPESPAIALFALGVFILLRKYLVQKCQNK